MAVFGRKPHSLISNGLHAQPGCRHDAWPVWNPNSLVGSARGPRAISGGPPKISFHSLSPVQAAKVPKPLKSAVDGVLKASIRKMAIILRKMAWLFLGGKVCSIGIVPLDLP